jgi:hypothetical protein
MKANMKVQKKMFDELKELIKENTKKTITAEKKADEATTTVTNVKTLFDIFKGECQVSNL